MKPVFLIMLFGALLLLVEISTGVYIFWEKYGFSGEKTLKYIHGDGVFISKKSFLGILKLNLPHFLSFSITTFIIFHLFYFFSVRKIYIYLAIISFFSGWINFLLPILIIYFPFLSVFKPFFFTVFIFSLSAGSVLLIYEAFRKLFQKC